MTDLQLLGAGGMGRFQSIRASSFEFSQSSNLSEPVNG